MDESVEHKSLRILMTADTVGGVWSYCMELCKAMQSFNIHFYLVTTGAPLYHYQKQEAAQIKNITLFETDFLLEWMENPWESIDASSDWLLQLEQTVKPDLIHLNCYAYGALPWQAPALVVAHSDVWSWWLYVKKEAPPASWNEYYQRVRNGLLGADYIVAPSQAMLHAVQKIYVIDTAASVIYNGRNSAFFNPAEKQPFVFSMGRIWDEAKNMRLLIEAAPHINAPIKLAGDSSFENSSTATAGITYLGKIEPQQVAAQLAAASLYVLPAKYEPFGLSVLEAALSGCALVLGNIDSLKEIWCDNAIYVETDNAAALAETVNYLMQHNEVRMKYSGKARQRAMRFTSETMAENYLQVYQQLLQRKESRKVKPVASNFFKTP